MLLRGEAASLPEGSDSHMSPALFTANEGEGTGQGRLWDEAVKPTRLRWGTLRAVPLSVTREENNTSNWGVSLSASSIQILAL